MKKQLLIISGAIQLITIGLARRWYMYKMSVVLFIVMLVTVMKAYYLTKEEK